MDGAAEQHPRTTPPTQGTAQQRSRLLLLQSPLLTLPLPPLLLLLPPLLLPPLLLPLLLLPLLPLLPPLLLPLLLLPLPLLLLPVAATLIPAPPHPASDAMPTAAEPPNSSLRRVASISPFSLDIVNTPNALLGGCRLNCWR
jgi:hypothetical protein